MVKMNAVYTGGLHCELKHGPSGSKIEADAALHCPVHKSLHPDIDASIVFSYE